MRRILRTTPAALLGLLAAALGCQQAPPPTTHPVHGTVLLDGQPLTAGVVEFRALVEPSVTTLGEIQPDSTFSLSILHEGKRILGAVPGEYRVTVLFTARKEKDKRAPIVLEKTRTVNTGDNAFTFELTSQANP